MQTKDQLGGIKERILIHRALGISVGAFAVFLLGFAIIPVIIASASATSTVSSAINWGSVSLTLDPDYGNGSIGDEHHGDVLFGEITPSANTISTGGSNYGTLKILKKTIGITSPSGKYYTVYLSTNSSTSNNLDLQIGNNESDSDINIPAIGNSATFAEPKAFTGSGWGYAVPGTTISGKAIIGGVEQDVVPSYVTPATTTLGEQITSSTSDTDIAGASTAYAAVWSPVPLLGNAQQIWKATTNNAYGFGTWKENEGTPEEVTIPGDTTNNHFNVYYAVSADTDQLAGTYENTVVYTALASASQLDSVSTNMARSLAYGGSGDTQTLKFDLLESSSNFIEENDLTIVLVPHSVVASNNYDVSSLNLANYAECDIVANSLDFSSGSYAEVECEMPSMATIKAKSGTSTADIEDGTGIGSFDYWLNIDGYNYNYVSITKDTNSNNVASFVYAGLQSKYYDAYSAADALATNYTRNGEYVVQNMQQMMPSVCQNTYKWSDTLGNQAKLYTADGVTDITNSLANNFWESTTEDGIGSFALKDMRDGKRYIVRRLADGKCWMNQNLNLDIYTGMTFTNEDTDLNTKTSWTVADAPNSNDERQLSSTDEMIWIPDSGSISKAWQNMHSIGTVTLKKYTYNGSNWVESIVAQCTGGTAQTPCYATTKGIHYYKPDGTIVDTTVAKADGFTNSEGNGSIMRGFSAGAYYETISYQVKQINANTNASWSNRSVGLNNVTDTSGTQTCEFSFYADRLVDATACVIETEGETLITQLVDASGSTTSGGLMTGYGAAPESGAWTNLLAITKDHLGNDIDFMNNASSATSLTFSAPYESYSDWPMSSNGGDYRWMANSHDGAHVVDNGPLEYSYTIVQENGNYSVTPNWYAQRVCGNVGRVSGELKLNSETVSFVSCLDPAKSTSAGENIALADTRVDGNWYNYYASVAGAPFNDTYKNKNAEDSICPKGWRLPKDSTEFNQNTNPLVSDYYALVKVTYGIDTELEDRDNDHDYALHAFPLNFVRSGYYADYIGGIYYRTNRGQYVVATSATKKGAKRFWMEPDIITPHAIANKGGGKAVRCIARD